MMSREEIDEDIVERFHGGLVLNSWEVARLAFLVREPWFAVQTAGGRDVDENIPECDEGPPDR